MLTKSMCFMKGALCPEVSLTHLFHVLHSSWIHGLLTKSEVKIYTGYVQVVIFFACS